MGERKRQLQHRIKSICDSKTNKELLENLRIGNAFPTVAEISVSQQKQFIPLSI